MEEFKAINTQEELDAIIKDRLKRERDAAQKRYEGWISPEDHRKAVEDAERALAELKKAHETDAQTIADLTAKTKAYETASLKSRIAYEVGLSHELASRINGEDEKSIREDAEALKKLVGEQKPAPLPVREPERTPANTTQAALRALSAGLNKE